MRTVLDVRVWILGDAQLPTARRSSQPAGQMIPRGRPAGLAAYSDDYSFVRLGVRAAPPAPALQRRRRKWRHSYASLPGSQVASVPQTPTLTLGAG